MSINSRTRLNPAIAVFAVGGVLLVVGGGAAVSANVVINGRDIVKNSIPLNRLSIDARQRLEGARGPAGAKGPAGEQGLQGETGEQGPQGRPGSGLSGLEFPKTIFGRGGSAGSVNCSEGKVAIGGGYENVDVDVLTSSPIVNYSTNNPQGTGWQVALAAPDSSFSIYAICANPS